MPGLNLRVLGDLFGAAEAVGEDGGFRVVADGGQEDTVGEGLGDFVFVFFEAEGAGHAAAAGVEKLHVGSCEAQEGHLFGCAEGGSVMAVGMNEDFLVELGRAVAGRELDEEFA